LEWNLETEWIILADHAEVINGKLYAMGGGWDSLTVNALPAVQKFAIAVSFLVPWNETNQPHDMTIELMNEDGRSFARVDGELEVGRPAGISLGAEQRLLLAVNLQHSFENLGSYTVVTRIEGQESNRISFRVVPGPQLLAQLTGPSKP
jgi:hypothetical protein